jgi:RNA polymerase sigma-70 factor (ECF subfamily)
MMFNLTPHEEATLIEEAKRDRGAFAALYRSYLSPIYRYLYQRLGNQDEAEDLTAQVFIEALEGLMARRYRERGKFVAWLYRIAHHKLIDFYRKRSSVELDERVSTPSDLLNNIEAGDDQARIAHLLAQLDDEKRELLRLRFTAGLSFAEIAAINGRSTAAIKMTIYRTLDWLRNHWEDDHG